MEEAMKKFMLVAIVAMLCNWSGVTGAEETMTPKRVSGSITLKNNWANPHGGEGTFFQTVSLFIQTPSFLGLGGDFTYQPKGDYVEYAPYLTVNSGPHYLLAGILANNIGGDYVQFGYWHINQYAGLNVVADLRAYLGTNGNSKSFLDNYLEVTYPVTQTFKAGIVGEDVYSLASGGNKFQAGPIVYYNVSKTVTILGRYLYAWPSTSAGTIQIDKFRLAVQYSF